MYMNQIKQGNLQVNNAYLNTLEQNTISIVFYVRSKNISLTLKRHRAHNRAILERLDIFISRQRSP